jgi:hypothetical protein
MPRCDRACREIDLQVKPVLLPVRPGRFPRLGAGIGAVLALLLFGASLSSAADTPRSVDVLVETLVEQGVLDRADADRVLAAGDDEAMTELVAVLKQKGILDDDSADRVLSAAASEATPDRESDDLPLIERFHLFGDFRNRYKGVFRDEDPTGNNRSDRNRGQLRFRLRAEAEVNRFISMRVGITTVNDSNNARRKNIDWGKPASGAPDEIRFDQIYSTIRPTGGEPLPWGLGEVDARVGKFNPPFISEVGRDLLVWDPTLTLDGAGARWRVEPLDQLVVETKFAGFVLEVAEKPPNPALFAFEVKPTWRPFDPWVFTLSPTIYLYRDVGNANDEFVEDGEDFGNIPGGLTDGDDATIVAIRATAQYTPHQDWPVELYASYVHNIDARDQPRFNAGKEDDAFSAGFVVGDPYAWVEFGAGFMRLEANAVPAQFPAFEPFDGKTNRDVWMFHVSRALFPNAVLEFEYFHRDARDPNITHRDAVRDSKSSRVNAGLTIYF